MALRVRVRQGQTRLGCWASLKWAALLWGVLFAMGCTAGDLSGSDEEPALSLAEALAQGLDCELSADCPANSYCDLGQCYQGCNRDLPCGEANVACSSRGQCVTDQGVPVQDGEALAQTVDVDVPKMTFLAEELYADSSTESLGMKVTAEVDGVVSTETIRYRVDPRVPWLQVADARGAFQGTLDVELTLNRKGLAPGQHTGVVVVHTTRGNAVVVVQLDQGVGGIYRGYMEYSSPRAGGLSGKLPIALEIDVPADREADMDGKRTAGLRVDVVRSPGFVVVGGKFPTASILVSDTGVEGTVVQRIAPGDLGEHPMIDRDVGREFSFALTATSSGNLSGTFTDTWHGMAQDSMGFSGTLRVGRVPGEKAWPIDPDEVPELPGAPDLDEVTWRSSCGHANCVHDQVNATDARACTQLWLDQSHGLEDPTNGFSVQDANRGYEQMSTECSNDLQNTSSGAPSYSGNTGRCISVANARCVFAFAGVTADQGGTADDLALEGLAGTLAAGIVTTNEALSDGYWMPYHSGVATGSVVDEVRKQLLGARKWPALVMQEVLWPLSAHYAVTADATAGSNNQYRAVQRLGHLLTLWRDGLDAWVQLERQSSSSVRDVLEAGRQDFVKILMGMMVLDRMADAQSAPNRPEFQIMQRGFEGMAFRLVNMAEGSDPMGLPPGFVEFLYDPLMAGPGGATNFQQVLAARQAAIDASALAETDAIAASRDYDNQVTALQTELEDIAREADLQAAELCGSVSGDPTQPDLDRCGSSSGQLAVADREVEEALLSIRAAQQRLEGLSQRVLVQAQRLREVHAVREDEIAFIDAAGRRIEALSRAGGFFSFVVKVLNPATWVDGGVFGAFDGLVQDQLNASKERLRQMQHLKSIQANQEVEYINGMATIKEMLIGRAELELEIVQTALRASTARIRAQNLRDAVRRIRAESELRQSKLLDPTGLANDPAYRVLRNHKVRRARASFLKAKEGLYRAARAFELETNTELPSIETHLLPATRAEELRDFTTCLGTLFSDYRSAYGVPQVFTDEVSLREDILQIRGPVRDHVTGKEVSEVEQFQRLLLQPNHVDGAVGVAIPFPTTLNPGNGVWGSLVCNDQIRSIQAQLVGDGLGDDQARVLLSHGGTSLMRSCDAMTRGNDDILIEYGLIPRRVEVQAGINAYPEAAKDAQLFGRPVAASEWLLTIPNGDLAPTNGDLDVTKIEDVVFRIEHSATSISESPIVYSPACSF